MSYNRDPLTKKTISQPYTQGVTNTSYQSMTHYGLKNQDIIKNQSGNNLRN